MSAAIWTSDVDDPRVELGRVDVDGDIPAQLEVLVTDPAGARAVAFLDESEALAMAEAILRAFHL